MSAKRYELDVCNGLIGPHIVKREDDRGRWVIHNDLISLEQENAQLKQQNAALQVENERLERAVERACKKLMIHGCPDKESSRKPMRCGKQDDDCQKCTRDYLMREE